LAGVPWHGWKASGPGVRNGEAGLLQFVDMQIVGETVAFEWLPWVRKAPWLFSQGAVPAEGAKALLVGMGGASSSLLNFPSMALLRFMWANIASKKL
jgi:hypothetical protein